MVDLVIVNYNTLPYLKKLLRSIAEHTSIAHRVMVVDNGSQDSSVMWLKKNKPNVLTLALNENRGYAYACNQGAKAGSNPYIIFLNSDILVTPFWLDNLLACLTQNPNIAVCGPVLVNPQGLIVGAGTDFSFKMRYWGANLEVLKDKSPLASLTVAGACYMIKRNNIPTLGLFDEGYFFYFEDLDYSFQALFKGYQVMVCPASRVIHFFDHKRVHGGSAGEEGQKEQWFKESEERFNSKWHYEKGMIKKNEAFSDKSGLK